jgi:hypothetical protein
MSPLLSVIVTIASDTIDEPSVEHLRPCLESLAGQIDAPPMEVIVPHQPGFPAIRSLHTEFPAVRFLEIGDLKRFSGRSGSREHHNELRARGVAAATGAIVALTEDHAIVAPEWCASIVDVHRSSGEQVAVVGGPIDNASSSLLSWAVYFREFGQFQSPIREVESFGPSDVNVSYKRCALENIREIWTDTFEERAVNDLLRRSGRQIRFSPRAAVYQKRINLRLSTALRERWIWGRSYGCWRGLSGARRLAWAAVSPVLPIVLVARAAVTVARKKRNRFMFLKALPLLTLITAAWCGGEMSAYLSGAKPARSKELEWQA